MLAESPSPEIPTTRKSRLASFAPVARAAIRPWIELKPWGYVYAQDASWSEPYASRWRPPYRWHYEADGPWRDGMLFETWWDFELDGDTLILTNPEGFGLESYRSRVVLERIPIPDTPAYPNPHTAY